LAGETLAMSNLAYKFMEVGFTEEAREQLDLALSKKDYHRNVGQAMTTLQDTPEKERKQLEKTLDELKPKTQFFKEAGRSLVKPDVSLNSAMWVGPDCTLAIQIKDRKFVGVGRYERKQSGLGLAISGEGTVQKYESNL
jgi:hypothetical protein